MHPGELFRQWREERKVKQSEMAAKLGVSQSYLSQVETGARRSNLELALAIERVTEGAIPAASWVQPEQPPTEAALPPSAEVA